MSTLAMTVWGHAGIRLERDGRALVVDPGTFTDPGILAGADAVLVTHEHADHVDVEGVVTALADGSSAEVWAPGAVVDLLAGAGAPAGRLHAVDGGDVVEAAGFAVQVVGHRHATIHPDLEPPANVGYLVDGAVLHPGDAFVPVPDGARVQALALPVSGPWLKLAEAVDYLRQVAPGTAVPVHDAVLSDAGRAVVDRITASLAGDVPYRRLAPGEVLEVPAG